MALLTYTTEIEAKRSASEVVGILASHGAIGVMLSYDGKGVITGIRFEVDTNSGLLSFRLPINAEAVLKVLESQYRQKRIGPRYVNIEQARRVAWRIIKHWVESQMALIEINMVSIEEVFLPYLLIDNGVTLFEHMSDIRFRLPAPK